MTGKMTRATAAVVKTVVLAAVAAAGAVSLPAAANCYTVLGNGGRVVFQSAAAPVDLSRQLHETVPNRFPGAQLVFSPQDSACSEIRPLPQASGADIPEGITRAAANRPAAKTNVPINLDNFFNDNQSSYGGYGSR